MLGHDYAVIEEGLSGRTTNLDSLDPPDRNGARYLPPCLYSHAPIDLVILMLGGNDLKITYNRTPEEVAKGIEELIKIIQSTRYGADLKSPPKILLIGYPPMSFDTGGEYYGNINMFKNGVERSKQFASLFAAVAHQYGCYYFDAAPHIHLSDIDGIHFDEECHRIFADLMFAEIKKIFI